MQQNSPSTQALDATSFLGKRSVNSWTRITTRDTIEETANIRGLPVVFIDTAGLREARDEIEQEGVRRSHESLAKAEFILHVLDASEPLTAADEKYFTEFAGKKRILVVNKIDLPRKLEFRVTRHPSLVTLHLCRSPAHLQNRRGMDSGTGTFLQRGRLSDSQLRSPEVLRE